MSTRITNVTHPKQAAAFRDNLRKKGLYTYTHSNLQREVVNVYDDEFAKVVKAAKLPCEILPENWACGIIVSFKP